MNQQEQAALDFYNEHEKQKQARAQALDKGKAVAGSSYSSQAPRFGSSSGIASSTATTTEVVVD